MRKIILVLSLLFMVCGLSLHAQDFTISGRVMDDQSKQPIEFAYVSLPESGLWAVTDDKGVFHVKNSPAGKVSLTIHCLGYATQQLTVSVSSDIANLNVSLKQETLLLDEVTVTAQRKINDATTSYTIDRTALDNQQVLSLSDVTTLLPGGKSVNSTLINDSRMALRSGSQEKGNASFGTAVEVDGMRMDNNSSIGETAGVSTRTVSASNIESVEVVSGIASVEYGDMSNGIVKVNTRKGRSPFIVEGKINQHTRQIAINKGFDLGKHLGVLNASFEHARSFSDAASPHTSYQRNVLSLNYMNVFMRESNPLTFNIGFIGNIGGLNSEQDPDQELDDYVKNRDNVLRAHMELNWLLNKKWISHLSLRGSFSTANHMEKRYEHESSATTLAYNHATEEGYFMATDYEENPEAPVILGPTGYWHVLSFSDSKPMNWSLRLKADWTRHFHRIQSILMLGAEYTGSRNNGKGVYYDDMRYAVNGWREYRYKDLPTMHNLAMYVEEKLRVPIGKLSSLELTAGIRDDVTMIAESEYGTVSSISPRFNGRYVFWKNQKDYLVSDLSVHAGWGKSVKLPSFQVLYPDPVYYGVEVFKSPSDADNRTVSAYYNRPLQTQFNPDLKWQHTNQTDLGVEFNIKGTRVAVSAFHHSTHNPYIAVKSYTPINYRYTTVDNLNAALSSLGIMANDAVYSINQETGVVTVQSRDGSVSSEADYGSRKTYYSNSHYVNASSLDRYGLEWIIDFTPIKPINTSIRLDGNYYYYKGADDLFFADMHNSNARMSQTGEPFQYVGWYLGTNAYSGVATASVSNGALSKQLNLNATFTTHVPKIRLIVALRIESTLYNYRRSLADYLDESGTAVYPAYYSTWDNPGEHIPFLEKYLWAKDNDTYLYNDLDNLVIRPNNAYTLKANRISSYYSANLSATKEIGDHVSVSFYANNFFNNMKTVHSSQTDTDSSLFGSGYIPSFYYGLSLRLKL